MRPGNCSVFLLVGSLSLKPLIIGNQDGVQFFDKVKKFLPILFYRYERTQFMDTICICLIHEDGGSITGFAVGGMFDDERF